MLPITRYLRKALYKTVAVVNPREVGAFIMCYHSISNNNWGHAISLAEFKQQIEYLLYRYKAITFKDIKDIIGGTALDPDFPAFALNFDDGYKDILIVKDYLKSKGIKPVLFLLSDDQAADKSQLDNTLPLLSKEDVLSLIADGWEIGSHGATHKDFWKLTGEEITSEIAGSKKVLEESYNTKVNYFSYPRGRYTPKIIEAVKQAGYELAVSMDDDVIKKGTNPYTLPRVGVMKNHDFDEFKTIMKSSVISARKSIKNFAGGIVKNYL